MFLLLLPLDPNSCPTYPPRYVCTCSTTMPESPCGWSWCRRALTKLWLSFYTIICARTYVQCIYIAANVFALCNRLCRSGSSQHWQSQTFWQRVVCQIPPPLRTTIWWPPQRKGSWMHCESKPRTAPRIPRLAPRHSWPCSTRPRHELGRICRSIMRSLVLMGSHNDIPIEIGWTAIGIGNRQYAIGNRQ